MPLLFWEVVALVEGLWWADDCLVLISSSCFLPECCGGVRVQEEGSRSLEVLLNISMLERPRGFTLAQ